MPRRPGRPSETFEQHQHELRGTFSRIDGVHAGRRMMPQVITEAEPRAADGPDASSETDDSPTDDSPTDMPHVTCGM